jgi:predicted TIM-barrel fold metal-dependent hydrolase
MTRRQLLRLIAALPGLGMFGCAAPGGVGLKRSEEETLAGGPRYEGPLIDCHSHVISRTPPGVQPVGEASLVRALGESGVDVVVAFGAAGGRFEGGRLVPVLALGAGLPSPRDVTALLAGGDYRGIKMSIRHFPFPMQPAGINGSADSAAVREMAAAAADTGWPLTLHLDGPDVGDLSRLCTAVPRASIVWAHAGTTPPQFGGGATPATVERMLDGHANLHVDLSARAPGWMGPLGPIQAGQPLLPEAWRRLILRHPTRVLFGLDIFLAHFLPRVPVAVAYWRRVLGELPGDVAAQVAQGNARRLYRL